MTAHAYGTDAFVPWTEGVLRPLTEIDVARWMADLGFRIVEHHGRFWLALKPGFYQPVHPLAELSAEQATAPVFACWGIRARLANTDAAFANAQMPVYMLPDLAGCNLGRLSAKRRNQVRKVEKTIDLVAVTTPDILLDQGYAVAREAQALNPSNTVPGEAAYRRWIISHFKDQRALILAGLYQGRLLGFSTNWMADGVFYQDKLYVGREGRARDLAMGLNYVCTMIAARHPQARELMCGRDLPQNPGIAEFKRSMGLRVVHLPARVELAPLVGPLLRSLRPHTYYRLTGRGTRQAPAV